MYIGLTYDLREDYLAEGYSAEETAEFDRPETIELLASALQELGHTADRVGGARHLIARLARGDRWDLTFNVAEGLHGTAREAQVPAILETCRIPYTFSNPLVMTVALHKDVAKTLLRAAGFPTPDFAVVRTPEEARRVDLPFPVFAKPVAEGTSKGITSASKIVNRQSLIDQCAALLEQFRQPVLVETFLPGREFTVGVLGTGPEAEVAGTIEVLLRPGADAEVYSYRNKENCEELVQYLPVWPRDDAEVRAAEEMALAVHRELGCRDAARVDFRSDARGRPHFLEINPLPGLHPEHSDLPILCRFHGIPYVELIRRILASTEKRRSEKDQPAVVMA
ncbi:MAG: D-alanine--D-alanine ligase [Pirellulales bacterium]|nr:D-alanine--D-alanine ligase [Pirellulales bacterium]